MRRRPSCPPLASRTVRLSAFARQRRSNRSLQPEIRRAGTRRLSSRPSPAPVLSPGSRFDGLTRPESHADLRRRPEHALRHTTSLYACCAFRDRADSRFRYEPAPHLPGCDAPGYPECAAFVDGAHHFFTTCRLATTRCAIMASDVGRGLRESCFGQRRSRARPLLEGAERRGIPSSREAPNTLCHRPGCVKSWSALHTLA